MKEWMMKLRRFLQRLQQDEKGVTLIELLAVVVILAIIAAVAVPTVLGQIHKSKVAADKSTEQVIADALQRAEFDYQSTGNSSGYIWLDPTKLAATIGSTKGDLLTTSGTVYAQVGVGQTNDAQKLVDLLTNGYKDKTTGKDTGHGFLGTIQPPSEGDNWQLSTTNTAAPSNVPVISFTFPDNSSGATEPFYLYPTTN